MNETAEVLEQIDNLPDIMLGITEVAIVEVTDKYKNLVISDTKTYEATKKARTEVVTMRGNISKTRKEITSQLDATKKQFMSEERRLLGLLAPIETELQATVKAWEDKKAAERAERQRKESERVEGIRLSIYNNFGEGAWHFIQNLSSVEIKNFCQQTKGLEITEAIYQEFRDEATEAKEAFLLRARSIYQTAKDREDAEKKLADERARLAEERAEIEKGRAELAEAQKVEQKKLDKERAAIEKDRREAEEAQAKVDKAAEILAHKVKAKELSAQAAAKAKELKEKEKSRLEALQPERIKLKKFAEIIIDIEAPDIQTTAGQEIVYAVQEKLEAVHQFIMDKCEACFT